jgi:hypothetical protein
MPFYINSGSICHFTETVGAYGILHKQTLKFDSLGTHAVDKFCTDLYSLRKRGINNFEAVFT